MTLIKLRFMRIVLEYIASQDICCFLENDTRSLIENISTKIEEERDG